MGRTRFSGPVYGGKETLFSAVVNISGSSGVFCRTHVPAGEDWYATELLLGRESTGVSGHAIVVQDDGVAISSVVWAAVTAGSTFAVITASAGEDEGLRIASGSVVGFRSTDTNTGVVSVTLRGYPRWVD